MIAGGTAALAVSYPLGIVFAAREPGPELQHVDQLDVRGSVNGDARALPLGNVHGPLDAAVCEQIIAESHGNPLALGDQLAAGALSG